MTLTYVRFLDTFKGEFLQGKILETMTDTATLSCSYTARNGLRG